MKSFFYFTLMLFLFLACEAPPQAVQENIKTEKKFDSKVEADIKRVVDDLYASITFATGGQPDFELFRKCFIPPALLINNQGDTASIFNPGQYVERFGGMIESGSLKAFREKEIAGTNEIFGKVAHRFSTYITYIDDADKIAGRGINSIQLIHTAEGWKISAISWDGEKEGQAIPSFYENGSE